MDVVLKVAKHHGLAVIEDNAHGLGGTFKGSPLGSFGALATQSFHATKNISCGEGGALVVNDENLVERAEILREKGTNRSQFYRHQADRYHWLDVGSSFLLSDLLAAVLTAQLEQFEHIQQKRHAVWDAYHDGLREWATDYGIVRPVVPAGCTHPAHVYHLLLPTPRDRDALISRLAAEQIVAPFHYVPLHSAPMGRRRGRVSPDGCQLTEEVSARLVRLPLHAGMSATDSARVVEAVSRFRPAA